MIRPEDVEFDEDSHTYKINGRIYGSVTSVLECLFNFQQIPPEVLAAKGEIGQDVHDACELICYDDLEVTSIAPEIVGYLNGFRAWLSESRFKVEETEKIVVSTKYGFAVPGRLDLVGKLGGWRWVIDIKTATVLNVPAARLQTAAYAAAYSEQTGEPVHVRGALQLRPNGTYKSHKFDGDVDLAAFLHLYNFNNWRSIYDWQ